MGYFLLPLRLLVPQHMPYEGPISWIFFTGLVWGLAQRRDKIVMYLSGYAILNSAFWTFFTSQQVRMLLPSLGTLSLVAGVGVASVAGPEFKKWILPLLMSALIVEGSWGVWRERSFYLGDQISVVLGNMSREDYLHKHFELADVFSFINTQLPPDGAVFAYNDVRGYLSRREFIFGDPSLQAYVDYDQLKTRVDLKRRLDELGVAYVLVNDTTGKAPFAAALRSIQDDLQLIYKQGTVYLYRLIPVEQAENRDCYVAWDSAYECRANIIPQIPVGEVTIGARMAQLFTSQCAGLNRVGLYMATYARDNTGRVAFRLTETASQQRVWEFTMPAGDIADDEWRDIDFAPLKDSEGKQYRLTVLSPDGEPGNAITVWRSQTDVFPNGEALVDGKPINADLIFRYGCFK
jgi:hypothetical protein